ncbi:MgtC/SapB family protein [Sporosarcina pasteurii]|uniref:Putative Mg(2+) transport ATPase n=2 Tax=Sporosarcina pasteurii TaxID=1474 RepID=A0A380C9Y0_SPOPA|nr:MgtC/SapB family protein [Sporosarcina pasteurii]MDS9472813.1 MgtC/SapB family protein [Sporosarcina pasteurii]SUJ14734.1 putative Mg(2+) transport ATPase [Sporosarcina pasteurii]
MIGLISETIYLDALMKIIIALALSLIIGVEREIKKKPIGFKTSAVIATFSCLLTIISIEAAYLVPARTDINVTMDPLRLAAQIVSGVGFLGAGAILRKDNDNITGLTTAAMIWGAASIGIAVGAGFYIEAAFAVLSVMLVIEVLAPILSKLGPKRLRQKEAAFTIILLDSNNIDNLIQYLESDKMFIENLRIKQLLLNEQVSHKLFFRISTVPKKTTSQLYQELIELPYVHSVEIEFFS